MSHFSVGVILPENFNGDLNEYLNTVLDPFDENKEVAPYPDECHCVGLAAHSYGREMAMVLVGSYRELTLEDSRQAWHETSDDYAQYHPLCGKADPDCPYCKGTGVVTRTYNQNRKWDWWRIGGRWDGTVTYNRQSSQNGFNVGKQHETVANNSALVSDLLSNQVSQRPTLDPDLAKHDYFRVEHEEALAQYEATPAELRDLYVPFALLTPAGEWVERGDMGWFAIVVDEKDRHSWHKSALAIYQKYSNCRIVILDCHI